MNKITVFCPVKEEDDFINSYDAVQDAISKLSTAEKVSFSKGFLFRERNAVEITDEEISSLKYDLGLKDSNDWDRGYNYAIDHLWEYIKSRINQ